MPNLYQFECGKGCSKALESAFPVHFFSSDPAEGATFRGGSCRSFGDRLPVSIPPELSWNSDGTQKLRGLSREEIHFIANFSQKV